MSMKLLSMQLFAIIFALHASFTQAFLPRAVHSNANSRVLSMSTGKTPLVANGKRFEADSGSSLIVVRINR